MRCRKARSLLSRRLDGRCDETAPGLDLHLARCPACAGEAARLERAWNRLEALAAPPAAPDDFAAVLRQVEARRGAPRRWLDALLPPMPLRRLAAAAVAAAVLAGTTAGVGLGRAAFARPAPRASAETLALAEGFGLLPFGSPAAGLAGVLAGGTGGRE